MSFTIAQNNTNRSTNFSDQETLVLQILPQETSGIIRVNGKEALRTYAEVYIPNSKPGLTISCPLNYFQDSVSLLEKWIIYDSSDTINLDGIDNLNKVIVTIKINDEERIIPIPINYSKRLLDYFKLDILNNPDSYRRFDCYALNCLLANVKINDITPEFEYIKKNLEVGDFIVLVPNDHILPDSIKHWALYLEDNLYLSKFGKSGEGKQSHLAIMDLEGMMTLYKCDISYVAKPQNQAKPWDGFNR